MSVGLPRWLSGKESACQAGDHRLGQEDPLEKGMATHSSVLAWKIPWTEEPGRLQSIRLQRVRHDKGTKHTPIQPTSVQFSRSVVSDSLQPHGL